MSNGFHLELTKTQLEILAALLQAKDDLEGESMSLRGVASLASLDYINTLFREKSWLLDRRIIVPNDCDECFKVNYDNIAYQLFVATNLRVIFYFAKEYLIPPKTIT